MKLVESNVNDWIGWEPAFRALLDGRKVHETGDVAFTDLDGRELDLDRSFTFDDDREEIAHFIEQAGFLHIRGVFDEGEMAPLDADIDEWIAKAEPDDGESWWAENDRGESEAVRVLFFYEKSAALRELANDDRYQWIGDLTGDGHQHKGGGEGLVKPLGIVRGLSDLPWHKDCGQGKHSYLQRPDVWHLGDGRRPCQRRARGDSGQSPRQHDGNRPRPQLDLRPRMLETRTGDVTVHCSDTLHRAYPPVERPRKVVYSGFGLPPLPGDQVKPDPRYSREARAALSDVQDRIEAADNESDATRYKAGPGH